MNQSEIENRAKFSSIRYAQCWEDPLILSEALKITPDDIVLSIASAGDNSFALLLDKPKKVIALDLNPAQIALCELKMAAIAELNWNDCMEFLGALDSDNRTEVYHTIRQLLSNSTKDFWDSNLFAIHGGVIHMGKFEKYFSIFRRFILPLIHTKSEINGLLMNKTLSEEEEYYDNVWNNWRWRKLIKIFFGKFLLGRLGRDPEFFRYVQKIDVSTQLLERAKYAMTALPTYNNWFMEFILTGKYGDLDMAHPYMNKDNFMQLKSLLSRLELRLESIESYLSSGPEDAPTKYNLSDIFEYMSAESVEEILNYILRFSPSHTRFAYWNLFVQRSVPNKLRDRIRRDEDLSDKLWKKDKAFFYSSFIIEELL